MVSVVLEQNIFLTAILDEESARLVRLGHTGICIVFMLTVLRIFIHILWSSKAWVL